MRLTIVAELVEDQLVDHHVDANLFVHSLLEAQLLDEGLIILIKGAAQNHVNR